MQGTGGGMSSQGSKYKISRRGRKLQMSDDQRTLMALPKEVPERTWAEILQKEENDLIIFDIREEILEDALKIGYVHYMEKQNAKFTAHCAAHAFLKIIDWHFYRHDPGEDPSAYPPCFIPKRVESWIPDELPDPSPKDTWSHQDLEIVEEPADEVYDKQTSLRSLEIPVVEEIPSQYWFPGKVNLPDQKWRREAHEESIEGNRVKQLAVTTDMSEEWEPGPGSSPARSNDNLASDSEVLQKVTDYSTEELSTKVSALKNTTPVNGSVHGAGDSTVVQHRTKSRADKYKRFSRCSSVGTKSKGLLPPIDMDSISRISIISDCRLRNLRLDTQFEISSEKMDTPNGEMKKRK